MGVGRGRSSLPRHSFQRVHKHQFVVVYPEQALTANGQRCWNWHQPVNQMRHQGEPAILAGLVRSVISNRTRWRIDPERVYAAGLSAGGAMASTLGLTYPELFAASGSNRDRPAGASSPTKIMPPADAVSRAHPRR